MDSTSGTGRFKVANVKIYDATQDLGINMQLKESASGAGQYGIIEKKEIAEKALPYCNIVCITNDEMEKALSGYLEVLYNADKSSVGGNLPGEDFYYKAK